MVRTAIQLYTLRDVALPLPDLLELVSEAGFAGVEFAGRAREGDPGEIADALARTDLEPAGAHVGLDALEDDREATLARYEAIGCRHLVVPWLDPEHFETREAIEAAGERLDAVAAAIAEAGFELHYHNHTQEFVDLDGERAWDAFLEATAVPIELDVGHVRLAGDDPARRLRELGDRATLVHVADVDLETGESVPLGEGDVDLDACAEAARALDAEWLIYEYEGEDPVDTLDDAAQRLIDMR